MKFSMPKKPIAFECVNAKICLVVCICSIKLWRPLFGVDKCKLCSFNVRPKTMHTVYLPSNGIKVETLWKSYA